MAYSALACALIAIIKRSKAKCCIIYEKPFPSSPIKFSSGIITLSNAISAVSEARQPNLSSLLVETPGVLLSRIKILIPLFPNSGCVLAATTI